MPKKQETYPPAPWALTGQMYSSIWWVPAAGCTVPLDPELVPIQAAGRVCVATVFVHYQPGSVLTYHEVLGGVLVRHTRTGRTGMTVPFIWVDSASSKQGGRELWGVPKEMARFTFDHNAPGGGFSGEAWDESGRPLLSARFTGELGLPGSVRPKLALPSLQPLRGELHEAQASIECAPRVMRARYTIPPESPLAALGIAGRRPLLSTWLKDFRTLLQAATPIR